MRNLLRGLMMLSAAMGCGLIGLVPEAGLARGVLVQGQEIALTECTGWLIQSSTAPAIESNAVYWFIQGIPVHPPGGHFRFRGEFPAARYMSWQNHDFVGNSMALLADTDIVPDRGQNPFQPDTPYSPGSAYTVDLLDIPPEVRPSRPANILYGGYRYDGRETEYNAVAYRVYLPDPGTDALGGVPRPDFYFVVDDPEKTSEEDIRKMCEEMRGIQETVKEAVIALVEGTESSDDGQNPLLSDGMQENPRRHVIDGPSATGAFPQPSTSLFDSDWALYWAVTPNPNGRGTFFNAQTGYLLVLLNPSRDEVTVMRFRAPTFPDTQGVQTGDGTPDEISGNEQLRYWSLCMHDTASLWSTAGCLYDAQVIRDDDGYVTFAVSAPESRPANAANWLPAAGSLPALILRHMQPNPAFTEAVLYYSGAKADPAAIAAHMGEYFPLVGTCARTEFERDRCGLDR
ncbi:hypothetical protein sS8_4163 [Methylocaldum marinum]|uniref:DUF1214 domain-containing protein n=1 Tax=Methylocaldum marinum TaxID=1432792 RepID=A0A250KWP9_9GAMM|nr:hypothetical protein [Methylocaldum marinum]BBA36093.1 hypothetical protein sS8_4163 [Methylocaldum marinum]